MAPIEKGSTVLVTGANGFIASHVVEQLLSIGYKVRGTVRSMSKGQWEQEYFDQKYGSGSFELVVVPDMGVEDAFREAVKGCSGVAHVASNMSFAKDPNHVIPQVIAGIKHTLDAADNEPSVKRFVYTSSSTAAISPIPDKEFSVDENSWNDDAVRKAWLPPPYDNPMQAWSVYAASKTQAEQELWKFVKERKPHFEVNSVLPNANFGKILSANQDASTAGWVRGVYNTKEMNPLLKKIPPQWFINVGDCARLHVAALIDPSITNERIFGFAEPYNWNQILAILRTIAPGAEFPPDLEDKSRDLSKIVPRGRAEEILKKNFGGAGFVSLQESLRQNIDRA